MASDSSVSCHDSQAIAASVTTTLMTLLKTELAVSVTTPCTPPTSLARRLWISPVRVSVKNCRGMRWRCAYSASRRSCMTCWPTMLLRYAWPTPMSPLMMGRMIISATAMFSCRKSWSGMAVSSRNLSRYGLMMPRKLVKMMDTMTTTTRPR